MAVNHIFKATDMGLGESGGVGLVGVLMLNGDTPVNVSVAIRAPSSPGHSEAVIFGPLSNAQITIETAAHENTELALRAASKVSIHFQSSSPVPDSLVAGQRFSSFGFSISRKLES